jgi:hypothetical protein
MARSIRVFRVSPGSPNFPRGILGDLRLSKMLADEGHTPEERQCRVPAELLFLARY